MKINLTCILLISMVATVAKADSTPNVQDGGELTAVVVTGAGEEIRASATKTGQDLKLSMEGNGGVEVELPQAEGVSEIRMEPWLNTGYTLAIETRNSETQEISYFWSTQLVNVPERKVGKPVLTRFFKSKIDYDIAGVVNSESDSIYITLLRHQRGNNSQGFDGMIYVNNCPVGPDTNGFLFPVEANSAVGQDEP